MSTKRQGVACYDKAGEDEPLFVLRAQDKFSGLLVRLWAGLAELGGTKPGIVAEARACAEAMDAWPFHKHPGTSIVRHEVDAPHTPQRSEE
jgi:hypothetical protein